jgi:hypothetical protein
MHALSFTLVAAIAAPALAINNPFTERFESSAAAWSSAASFIPLTYQSSGGPDGSGYGSTQVPFANLPSQAQPLIFRGQSNFNSSGNAFVGDWLSAGVTEFSFAVRHNAPEAISFFSRFSPPGGAGIVGLTTTPVQPNTWTTLTVAIDGSNPLLVYEFTSFGLFANIARTQVGIMVPAGLANNPGSFTFDIDNVSITPSPGASAVLGLGLLAARRRR